MNLASLLNDHLWKLIAAVLAAWSGYLTTQINTRNEIADLTRKLTEVRTDLDRQRRFNTCSTYHLTRLETGQKGEVPRCLE